MKTTRETGGFSALSEIRHWFHQHPELSQQESTTSAKVVEILSEIPSLQIHRNIGGHGIVAEFISKSPGPQIMIRGDMDALPIHETGTPDYKSKTDGVMHACGHDGHTTILIALAQKLHEQPVESGSVLLLFQPSEENGHGAQAVLNDEKFIWKSDFVFALHNLPGYERGKVVWRNGSFTASVISVIFKLKGKTSHAGEPENGINPGRAMAEMMLKFLEHHHDVPDSEDFAVITPVYQIMGDHSYGISAGYGEIHLTIRTWTENTLQQLTRSLLEDAKVICAKYDIKLETETLQHFRANENNEEAIEILKSVLTKNSFPNEIRPYPFKWGEDFGLFTQKFKGAMFGVGSGKNHPALHNPDYDFPDEIIPVSTEIFYQLIKQTIREK
ncbi:MAG: amidohydrolase [Bacteroidetes bacterium]|nr:amidohydrolase [Bacteroidota bacterium]